MVATPHSRSLPLGVRWGELRTPVLGSPPRRPKAPTWLREELGLPVD
jgi:hypothetical protein